MHASSPRSALRRLALAAALGCATALSLAAPADAGAPTRIDSEYWGVTCVGDLGDGRTIFVFGSGATDGAEGGVGAFVEDAAGNILAEGQATAFSFGDTFSVQIPLDGTTFDLSADAVAGESITEVVNERDGNSWTKGTTTRTEVAMTPTSASYDGTAVVLGDDACTGDLNAFDVATTNPSATVLRDHDFDSEICDVAGLADGQVRITGALPIAFVEVVLDHGGEDVEKLQGEVRLKAGRGTLTTDVRDIFTGEVRTTATVGLELVKSERSLREVSSDGSFTETRTVTPYRETVTVALADGRRGTATCSGIAVTTQVRIKPAR